MNSHLFWSALKARYAVLLFVLGITVAATAGVSLLLPKTYVAKAAMLVDSRAEQSLSSFVEPHVRERTGYMQTQVDIIASRKVARQVVSDLGLPEKLKSRAILKEAFEGQDSLEDRLAASLLKRLKVDTSQSSVIHLSFSSVDARFSALAANAFAKAYMDTALELRVEPSRQTAAWFDEQIKTLRDNLELAQARLADYQREKGVVTHDERLDADSIALTGAVASLDKRGAARSPQPGAYPRATRASERSAAVAALHQRARDDLARAELQLQELDIRLGGNHPAYRRKLAETDVLRAEVQRTAAEAARLPAPREARDSFQAHDSYDSRNSRDAAQAQQLRVAELRQYRSQVAVLTRDVELAQRAYDAAMQRAMDKKVESHARLSNVSVLNAAAVPFEPARPRIALNIGLSAVAGLLLGLCTVYFMEMFDRRVRSVDDLDAEWHVPLLAELNASPPAHRRLSGRPDAGFALPGPS